MLQLKQILVETLVFLMILFKGQRNHQNEEGLKWKSLLEEDLNVY